jgi:predicted porin
VDIDSFVVSAKFNINDKSALKAQFGDVGYDEDTGATTFTEDGEQLSVGYDYSLSKNTTLFAYYTQETYEEESVEVMDDQWVGLGIDLKF